MVKKRKSSRKTYSTKGAAKAAMDRQGGRNYIYKVKGGYRMGRR